ncbi:retrovirus-related pol polyprotein from transposon TNT 1-94 [Tanacetum coccineum]
MSVQNYLKRSIWYLDNGYSRHMTWIKQYMHRYSKESGPKVVFGDDSLGNTEGYGLVNCNGITFTRVAYVNGLKHNLISISQLCDANYKVLFTKTQGTIYNQNDEVVLIAPRRRDVYVIDKSSFNKESNALAPQSGIPLRCDFMGVLQKGKHDIASFKTKRSFSINKSLHLLHMDLFGPFKPQTINHNKYTLVIVDEYSRYTWVFCLKKKSDAADCIMSFIKKMKNLNEVRVKELRNDNGTEFRNHKLEEFCNEKEAVNTAYYTQNRSIIVKRHRKTAYDVFKGRSPDISYFHVFGCHVQIHNHRDHLGKFDEKADDEFFLVKMMKLSLKPAQKYFPYVSAYDNITLAVLPTLQNSVTSEEPHEFTIAGDLPANHELDHAESANILESVEPQDNVLSESISDDQPTPVILPSTEVILQNPIPQDRWVRDSDAVSSHECLYVNFLSKSEPKKLIEALEEEGLVIAMQEELNQFERNKV